MERTNASFFREQANKERKQFEGGDNEVIKGRIDAIDTAYAERLLHEAEAITDSNNFLEEMFQDSFVDGNFKEWKLCEIVSEKEEDGEIKVDSFRTLDSAVVGKMLIIWAEKRARAN